jgi:methyl-accepting chemotaxis protein
MNAIMTLLRPLQAWTDRLSLRAKLLTAAGTIAGFCLLLALIVAVNRMDSALQRQLILRGLNASVSTATALEPLAVDQKAFEMATVVTNLQSSSGVAYAYVIDPTGRLLAFAFSGPPPQGLAALHPAVAGQDGPLTATVTVGGQEVIDTVVPLMQGSVGSLHVGLDLAPARAERRRLVATVLFSGGAILALALALLWMALGQLVSPLNELNAAVLRIVEEGDLTQTLANGRQDEVGQLARSFQRMVDQLREIPAQLGLQVRQTAALVGRLSAVVQEQRAAVQRQATSLEETQVTAEEIRQISAQAAGQAREVLQAAKGADLAASSGESALMQTLEGLGAMRAQTDVIIQRVRELDERKNQLGHITETVKDLADQSNLLALNAGIEAMRAGEHGKGFGLVAREVRELAEQSRKSTDQVEEILGQLDDAIRQTVELSASGGRRMDAGMEQMKASAKVLRELAALVRSNSESVRRIAEAVAQQDTGVGQIFAAVRDQNLQMESAVKQSKELTLLIPELEGVARSLGEVVGRFKT